MKILTLSDNAWDDKNSIGNTYSNFFSDWNLTEFTNIFLREAAPNNKICKTYYRITDMMLLKNIFTPSKIGYEFSVDGKEISQKEPVYNEKKLISIIHRYNLKIIYFIEELLWKLNGWQNNKLKFFINKINPDIIFSFALTSLPVYTMIKYLRKNTNAKIVLFIADNVYGKYFDKKAQKKPVAKRFCEIIKLADKIYGASEEICRIYGSEFGLDITPLYKGCDFNNSIKASVGSPISITYAGNLLYGRLNTLALLANEIERINQDNQKYFLKIYSGTLIANSEQKKLNVSGSSQFCGSQKYEEIIKILNESDIVLHIESFDSEQIDSVKYSFSTKIIDCLQSGSVLMVIGPKGISSVEYPKKIPGVIVIDDIDKIGYVLNSILDNADNLKDRAASIRLFAKENHSLESVHKKLQADFTNLMEENE